MKTKYVVLLIGLIILVVGAGFLYFTAPEYSEQIIKLSPQVIKAVPNS